MRAMVICEKLLHLEKSLFVHFPGELVWGYYFDTTDFFTEKRSEVSFVAR